MMLKSDLKNNVYCNKYSTVKSWLIVTRLKGEHVKLLLYVHAVRRFNDDGTLIFGILTTIHHHANSKEPLYSQREASISE